ncbi:ATP phosphoribosyltransferase regulatory subunit [Paludibacterium purpuratum]|uniref:Histidyl-tRNA synthetase n=1 Tax=Paludibacterium purpuratum TaxID=1144873 RepID=A0A4R7B0Z2_9NEIS|nr:ATP phosphoribosyltransferase regulatory subunit [Paludibacterium purpuratum]TDR73245.1 histidyl-tRNA synthetase [Paludibacterium purpuratum]
MAPIGPSHGTAMEADNLRHWVEAQIRAIMHRYGYQEIRLPALEGAAFADERDVAAVDRLRPDGLPSCVRAVLAAHAPARRGIERLWFLGPVLWHGPQGPRQTVQFGVVAFNAPGAAIEAELVLLISELWQALGVAPSLELRVGNLGSWQEQHRSAARFGLQTRRHFAEFTHLLDSLALPWRPDPHCAAGRGYFNHTVFDWRWRPTPDEPGLCNGGRCDDLASRLSARALPAAGLAIDIERLMACLGHYHRPATQAPPRVTLRAERREQATDLVLLGRTLRARLPGYHIHTLLSGMALDEVPDPADWRLILRRDGLLTVWSRRRGVLGELARDALIALLNNPGADGREE